jgi:hypothetical protein
MLPYAARKLARMRVEDRAAVAAGFATAMGWPHLVAHHRRRARRIRGRLVDVHQIRIGDVEFTFFLVPEFPAVIADLALRDRRPGCGDRLEIW